MFAGVEAATNDWGTHMQLRSFLVAVTSAAALGLVFAATAAAKGPSAAKIEGPGLSSPLVLKGNGEGTGSPLGDFTQEAGDRKSTRLNSSHSQISYAVFCLKKKNQHNVHPRTT